MTPCIALHRSKLILQLGKDTTHYTTRNTAMSTTSKAKRSSAGGGLHGPRPQPLSLTTSPPPSKKPRFDIGGGGVSAAPGPVIVYERTPRVVHARPEEFMAVVQRLTGKQQPTTTLSEEAREDEAADALVLTLGQQQQQQRPASSASYPAATSAAASLVLSPGSFIFSPATMQAIRELIS